MSGQCEVRVRRERTPSHQRLTFPPDRQTGRAHCVGAVATRQAFEMVRGTPVGFNG